MYRAYNLTCDWKDYSNNSAVALNEANQSVARKALQEFLTNGKIDGTAMQNDWFPKIKTNVFISHSHADEAEAIKLAGYLRQEYELDSFIDSCVWGYADNLLKQIDDKYCLNENGETYSYQKRNGSTSHVHMMLSTAIGKMIDAAECVIFLNTPNSITSDEVVTKTKSPWIYYELGLMRLIRKRTPPDHRPKIVVENLINKRAAAALQIDYSISLGHLTAISTDDLNKWSKAWPAHKALGGEALDVLYDLTKR